MSPFAGLWPFQIFRTALPAIFIPQLTCDVPRMSLVAAELLLSMKEYFLLLRSMQSRNHTLAIATNEAALVAADVMNVHLREAEIEEALDMLAVRIEVG